MTIHKIQIILPFLLACFVYELEAQTQECFLLMAGKECSVSGEVFLAHNNELSGIEASMLKLVPSTEKINLLPGNKPLDLQAFKMLILQTNKGFAEGDAVAINEFGVAIAGGLSLKTDRNSKVKLLDPLLKSGLGGGVRYLALQHSKTARECIQLMGELYTEFGIKYPSGVGVADSNENWYMETGGGRSWAAIRIPNDHFFVAANSYRIGNISFSDSLNFISSYGLQDFCINKGLWDGNKVFNFSLIFGGGRKEKTGSNLYNSLRVWRAINLLCPDQGVSSESEYFPMFMKPYQKISLETLFSVLRDYYNNSLFDIWAEENLNKPERSIADWNCVHTSVISLNPGQEVDYGSVLWTGLSTPYSAVYIPVYFGVSTLPSEYEYAPRENDINSAFWIFKNRGDSFRNNYPLDASEWILKRKNLEKSLIVKHKKVVKEAAYLFQKDAEDGRNYLNQQTYSFARQALKISRLESKSKH